MSSVSGFVDLSLPSCVRNSRGKRNRNRLLLLRPVPLGMGASPLLPVDDDDGCDEEAAGVIVILDDEEGEGMFDGGPLPLLLLLLLLLLPLVIGRRLMGVFSSM
jgi:hypothetical protein